MRAYVTATAVLYLGWAGLMVWHWTDERSLNLIEFAWLAAFVGLGAWGLWALLWG